MKYIQLIRAKQWVKNLFLFLPVFFGLRITDFACLSSTIIGFFAFSFFASSIYIINDYRDIEKDRLHPKKKKRPLASGAVSKNEAIIVFIVLMTLAIGLSLLLPWKFLFIALAYVTMNLAYSLKLKEISLLDITIISIGFVLRIFAGAVICNIYVSVWLVAITFLLALFIALAKRRDDVLIFLERGDEMRDSIKGYNLRFLDTSMSIMASVVIVAYLMYTISEEVMHRVGNEYMYFTVVFVVLGILRYLQITLVKGTSGSPTDLLYKDLFLQLILFGWVVSFIIILYFV